MDTIFNTSDHASEGDALAPLTSLPPQPPVDPTYRKARGLFHRKILFINLLIALLFLGAVKGWLYYAPSTERFDEAPLPFSLPEIRRPDIVQHVSLSPKWQLINFWASWCEVCKEETPRIQQLAEFCQGTASCQTWGVATYDEWEHASTSDKVEKVSYPLLIDEGGDIAQKFNVHGLPQTFAIDPSGRIRYHVLGAAKDSDLENMKDLITQP